MKKVANFCSESVSMLPSCVHVYDYYHAALVDIRQRTVNNVMKPKVAKETLQSRF